ncbi:MAG: hypothetical protein K0R99_820 [Microbacterium sp.]|jgi:hypothetical protein|uniref:hypothetical protein n=1 Tax=Microbacterium sp. TaxID=51671 RepID=UPI00262D41CE|nr:hypothetical protein [Microbacterium sp.]MDF2559374.1 hypothetical protein [Microbacterium sp.]
MTPSFSPERSEAIRAELITTVARTRPSRSRGLWAAALVLVGTLAGAGISTAAFAATGSFSPTPNPAGQPAVDTGEAIVAPPGTEPGSPVISLLGTPQSLVVEQDVDVALDRAPREATHVRVTVTMTSPGTLTWGPDPGGNNPSSQTSAADIGVASAVAWYDFPLDGTATRLYFHATPGASATAVLQYLNQVPTRLGVNEHGDTFGVEGGPEGAPDLVRVTGVADDGREVEGYAWASELSAFSPDHDAQPSTPKEAVEWQEERDEKYPSGWDIRVYESDGRTDIGAFHVG